MAPREWLASRYGGLQSVDGNRIDLQSYRDFVATSGVLGPVVGGRSQGVYFVKSGEFIKIGKSRNVCARWREDTDAPLGVERLGFIHVNDWRHLQQCEWEYHWKFQHLWHRGEWFLAAPELLAFIAEQTQPWPDDHH